MKQMMCLLLVVFTFLSLNAYALKVKVATLVPKGTNWAKTIQMMVKEVELATQKKVRFKVFYGGVQGDEPDVLRKMRIGQLHGGIFTGKSLGDIVPDIRAIELPFNFYHDDQKAMATIAAQQSYFDKELEKNGFVNLGFYGIGKVYVVSTKKVTSIKQLRGIKMWAWEGDKIIRAMMDSLGLVSVPLALPDVMSSLSTGIIEAAYAPPLAILALQWQNKIKYIIDFPTAYSIGALLVSTKQWSKIKPEHQVKIKKMANKFVLEANKLAKIDNKKALETLKKRGVELVRFSKQDLEQAEQIRKDVIKKLEGVVLSKDILRKVESMR